MAHSPEGPRPLNACVCWVSWDWLYIASIHDACGFNTWRHMCTRFWNTSLRWCFKGEPWPNQLSQLWRNMYKFVHVIWCVLVDTMLRFGFPGFGQQRMQPSIFSLLSRRRCHVLDKKPLGQPLLCIKFCPWFVLSLPLLFTLGQTVILSIGGAVFQGTFIQGHPLQRTSWVMRCGRLRNLGVSFVQSCLCPRSDRLVFRSSCVKGLLACMYACYLVMALVFLINRFWSMPPLRIWATKLKVRSWLVSSHSC